MRKPNTADYRYDGHGQRVAKTLNGQTTAFHYNPVGHRIAESNAQGLPLREYVYLDDLPLALLTSGQTYFIHPDHLGTPQVLTDAAQQVAWSADDQPFGELARTSAAVDHPLRFPGQYYDEESGLHYNTFRDYDPATGRYVQSDPIGLEEGINTYLYAGGNPVLYIDPLGLDNGACVNFCTVAGGVIGGFVGRGAGGAIGALWAVRAVRWLVAPREA